MTEKHSPPTVKVWCAAINPSRYYAQVEGFAVKSFPSLKIALKWVYDTLVELRSIERDAALNAALLAMQETTAQSNRSWLAIGEDLKAATAWLWAEHYRLHPEEQVSDDTPEPQTDDHPTG